MMNIIIIIIIIINLSVINNVQRYLYSETLSIFEPFLIVAITPGSNENLVNLSALRTTQLVNQAERI